MNIITHLSAQMITSAISVGSDFTVNLGNGPTFGILCAILFCHGIVCSCATNVIARLNLFYVTVNSNYFNIHHSIELTSSLVATSVAAIIALLVGAGSAKVSTQDAFTLFENNTGWTNSTYAGFVESVLSLIDTPRWLGLSSSIYSADVDSHRV